MCTDLTWQEEEDREKEEEKKDTKGSNRGL